MNGELRASDRRITLDQLMTEPGTGIISAVKSVVGGYPIWITDGDDQAVAVIVAPGEYRQPETGTAGPPP